MSKSRKSPRVREGHRVAALYVGSARPVFGQAPAVRAAGVKPVVIASANGNRFRNGGTQTAVEKAFATMTAGADVLDALIAGVNIVELDPEDTSVGYGGLPNADGVVQLDACCMHGPRKRAGGVASLEGVRTPSNVAQKVMDVTDHHLLVGSGAQSFARSMGFTIEGDLNTPRSRERWLEWKRRTDPDHYLDPAKRAQAWHEAGLQMVREGLIDPDHYWGTINCDGRQRARRDLRRDDHERPGVEDSGARGRLADSRRGAVRRRRGRRRRIDWPRRGESLQPVLVPDRRGDAARRPSEGCGHHGTQARAEEHRRKAPPQLARTAELRPELLCAECEGRIRWRVDVRVDVTPSAPRTGAETPRHRGAAAGTSDDE